MDNRTKKVKDAIDLESKLIQKDAALLTLDLTKLEKNCKSCCHIQKYYKRLVVGRLKPGLGV